MAWGEPVTRIRATVTGVDRYDNPVTTDVETELPPAAFAPEGSPEQDAVGRIVISQSPTLYWREVRPDVVASDRLRVRGVEYAVDGVPADWRDPNGGPLGGLVVRLSRSDG